MLVWDSYKCDISDARKEELKQYNTVMSVLHGGCTKFLQLLEVCITSFLSYFFSNFMTMVSKR